MLRLIHDQKKFQHTAARRRLRGLNAFSVMRFCFNTQPRGGGCFSTNKIIISKTMFQHTAARRRLLGLRSHEPAILDVSTHSRAEAAAPDPTNRQGQKKGFNTQPRGGGCFKNRW